VATIGNLVDILLERVRDAQGQFHARSLVREVFLNCQWQMYLALKPELSTTTLSTVPGQNHYRLTTNNLGLRVMHVRDGGRDLTKLSDFSQFTHLDRLWWGKVGPRHEAWTQLGQDYLLIYPTSSSSITLDIVYVPMYVGYGSDGDTVLIPQEYHESLLRLAEGIILLRQKDFAASQQAINRFIEEARPEFLAERLHVVQDQPEPLGAKLKEG